MKQPNNEDIQNRILFALTDPYKKGIVTQELRRKISITDENVTGTRHFFQAIKFLRKKQHINHFKKGRNVINFLPQNRSLAEKKYKMEKQIYLESKRKIRLDFTKIIDDWIKQLPCDISICNGIRQKSGIRCKNALSLNVKINSLFPDFKEYVNELLKDHQDFCKNPFLETERFDKEAPLFIKKREKLIKELARNILDELNNKENRNIEIFNRTQEGIEIPIELIRGILYRLSSGVTWKSGGFSRDWFKVFISFNSHVHELPYAYGYYVKNLEETMHDFSQNKNLDEIFENTLGIAETFQEGYIFISSIQKNIQNKKKFKEDMDKRMENLLITIGQSKQIKNSIIELWKTKEELYNILSNICDSLEKIKSIKD